MSNPYDWIIDLPESTAMQILDAIGCTPANERQPTAQALLEAIVQLLYSLYGTETALAIIIGDTGIPKSTVDEIKAIITRKTKGDTVSDNKPAPKQPDRPTWLQHSSNKGLLDMIISISHSIELNGETMTLALEEYVTRVSLHQAMFNIIEADADGSVLSSLNSTIQAIWDRYTKDHKERSIPF